MQTLIKNGFVATERGLEKQDVLVVDGVIREIGKLAGCGDENTIDAQGCYVLPGLVDAHVHFNMLSGTRYTDDDFTNGTLGAVRGGVTSVIDFARPIPDLPPTAGLQARIREASGNCYTDFALHMSMQGWYSNRGLSDAMLGELADMGVSSLKFFTTYSETRIRDERLEAMLPAMKKLGLLPMIHAEKDSICAEAKEKLTAQGKTGVRYHGMARPREAEIEAVRSLISMAEKYDIAMYIAHVSTAEAAELIRSARKRGLELMGETCPHYLVKTEEVYGTDEAIFAIASPPLRTEEDSCALFEALRDGTLQCISSDHCAFAKDVKQAGKTCFDTAAGISGVETILPIMYTYGVKANRLTIDQMVKAVSTNPAKIFGLHNKGELMVGKDGDMIIFDPHACGTLSAGNLVSRSGYCLYEGIKYEGAVKMVLLRGNVVHEGNAAPKMGRYARCEVNEAMRL